MIGLIYRQYYQYSNTDTLKQLYISSVRPHLEYAAVWDPHLQKDISKLEKVQTFALRMCTKTGQPIMIHYLLALISPQNVVFSVATS